MRTGGPASPHSLTFTPSLPHHSLSPLPILANLSATLLTRWAGLTILTNLDDPTGQNLNLAAGDALDFGPSLRLFADAVATAAEPGQPPRLGLHSLLFCCDPWLQTPLCPDTRQRLAGLGTLNLLLRWLADLRAISCRRTEERGG